MRGRVHRRAISPTSKPLGGDPLLRELGVGGVQLDPDPVAPVTFGDEADRARPEERVKHHAAFGTGGQQRALDQRGREGREVGAAEVR